MRIIFLLITFIISPGIFAQGDNLKNMVLIPGNDFIMGKDSEKGYDFSPAHKVHVDSLY